MAYYETSLDATTKAAQDAARAALSSALIAQTAASGVTPPVDTAIAAAITGSAGTQAAGDARWQRNLRVNDVRKYGAVLNGSTDDTTAIQAAIDDVSALGLPSLVVGFGGATASVSSLTARSRVHIDLQGGTLKARSATPTGVIMSPAWAGTGHIDDFTVSNGTIDINNLTNCGVIAKDAARVTVDRVNFINIKDTSSGAVNLNTDTTDCRVTGCSITMTIDPTVSLTQCPGIQCTSTTADVQGGGQNANLTFTAPTNLSQGHQITGNRIIGGTHGVALFGAAFCRVSDNHIESPSHRGVIMSPVACDNTITGNTIVDFISSGIHMAWGSCRNTITGNTLRTSVSSIEGNGIKGYYGCSENSVVGNSIKGCSLGAIWFAVGSIRNHIVGNRIGQSKYGVHLQNGLTTSGYYQPASLGNVDGTTIVGNTIDGQGSPGGNVGILLQTDTVAIIRHSLIASNVIMNMSTGIQFNEAAGGGAINNMRVFGNSIEAVTKWTAARGTAHMLECYGNGAGMPNKVADKTTTPASTTSAAPLNLPAGSAPTTPADGDVWTTTAGLFVRVNGATVGPLQNTPTLGGLASGLYYQATPSVSLSVITTGTGTFRATPFVVPRAVTLSRIGLEVTVAGDVGSLVRLGIYADNGSGYPDALVLDAGTVAGDAVGVAENTISQALTPGLYWVGAVAQNVTTTQPSIRGIATTSGATAPQMPLSTSTPATNSLSSVGFAGLSITGALPSTFPSTVNVSTSAPRIFVKVA